MQATPTSTESPAVPSLRALERAHAGSQRARAAAQLRLRFVNRGDGQQSDPPLARMLRGGRGGQVRLKLFLSFLWFQTDGARAVQLGYPAQVWAELLDLPDPKNAGARRINEAQRWLETNGFITVRAQPGHSNQITVLSEIGDGQPYTPPGRAANLLRGKPQQQEHLYTQIPAAFWTNGYMAALNGAGLAFFLILLDQYGPGSAFDPDPVWFSPKVLKERYALSDDTRAKGMRDLKALGLVTVRRQPINPNDFDLERIRNTYILDPGALDHPIEIEEDPIRRRPPAVPPDVKDLIVEQRQQGRSLEQIVLTLQRIGVPAPRNDQTWSAPLIDRILRAAMHARRRTAGSA